MTNELNFSKRTDKVGISLIALVITVVVMVVLAGAIILTFQNTNTVGKATEAVFKTNLKNYKEQLELYVAEKILVDRTYQAVNLNAVGEIASEKVGGEIQNIEGGIKTIIPSIKPSDIAIYQIHEGKLVICDDSDESYQTWANEINIPVVARKSESDISTSEEGVTLAELYSSEDLIGEKINYTDDENSGLEWVILGEGVGEEAGYILAVPTTPVEGIVDVEGNAENWLKFESIMHDLCSVYGNANLGIQARSITLEDINRVSGISEQELAEEYYMRKLTDEEIQSIENYYHPSYNEDYWEDDYVAVSGSAIENEDYDKYSNSYYEGRYESSDIINSKIREIIFGDDDKYYLVASCCVYDRGNYADFLVAVVSFGYVYADAWYLCSGSSDRFDAGYYIGGEPALPVVLIPSNIQVEKTESGIEIIE